MRRRMLRALAALRLLAAGDLLVAEEYCEGTRRNASMGIPATGRRNLEPGLVLLEGGAEWPLTHRSSRPPPLRDRHHPRAR